MMVCIAGQVSENPKTRPRLVGPVAPMLCGKCPSFGTEAGGLNRSPAGDLKDHFFWISLEGKRTGAGGGGASSFSLRRGVLVGRWPWQWWRANQRDHPLSPCLADAAGLCPSALF